MMRNIIMVGLGGMIGSMLRYMAALLIKSNSFPYSTVFVNIAGSLIIGILFGISVKNDFFNQNWKLFFATGICGGFTTFSTFSLECLQMLQQQRYSALIIYTGLSIFAGIAAVFAGFWISK